MRKLQKRKRLNVVIIFFAMSLLAGSAFALVSAGPLIFSGTSHVDASLQLLIVRTDIKHNTTAVPLAEQANSASGSLYVYHNAIFDAPQQFAEWTFWVKNTGTIPAEIDFVKMEVISDSDPNFDWGFDIRITNIEALMGKIINPGEEIGLNVLAEWNPNLAEWNFQPPPIHGNVSRQFATRLYYILASE